MLLTAGKRKISRMEMEAEEAKEIMHKSKIEEMSHKILQLKHKIDDFEQRDLANREDSK